MPSTTHLLAIGGAGLSKEPDAFRLLRYLLDLTGRDDPRLCYLPTAGGDSDTGVRTFYDACQHLRLDHGRPVRPSHLRLFNPPTADLTGFLGDHDAIYVGGGNTRNLLVLWREWGLDVILRDLWQDGVVLGGSSAGSICWFEEGITDSIPNTLTRLECLGFLPGSNCPHYDSEAQRRPTYERMVADGTVQPGLAADDGVGLHFVDGAFERAVASRLDAAAYRVAPDEAGGVHEERIEPDRLGD